jgi:hypothetical protein
VSKRRRKAEKLPLHGVAGLRHDPLDVLLGVEADLRRHDRQVEVPALLSVWTPTRRPFRSPMLLIGSRANSS